MPDVDCTENSQCADDNDCTQDLCTEGSCLNPNEDEGTSCSQDGGAVCDGDGSCVECNVNGDCDAGDVCLDNNICVGDPDIICDEGLCAEDPEKKAQCVDAFLLCIAGNPNEAECALAGLIFCSECTSNSQCDDENQCTDNTCDAGTCVSEDTGAGETCDENGGSVCDGNGACVGCNVNAQCPDDNNECTSAICDGNQCGQDNEPANTACTVGGSVCDGAGNCVECNVAGQCPDDTNECTVAACTGNQCGQANVSDGTSCDGGNGECQSGICEDAGLSPFTMTGEFRAYNNLLPAEGAPAKCDGQVPAGPPVGTCSQPDLCQVPGSTICSGAGITTQCTTTTPTGSIGFTDDGAGTVAFTGSIDQTFQIPAVIDLLGNCAVLVNVTITTNSATAVSGSGAGAVAAGSTVTLDEVTAPEPPAVPAVFNVIYVGDGAVNCEVEGANPATICPLAGLMAGLNPLPQAGDPEARVWPALEFSDAGGGSLGVRFQGGSTVPGGWSLNNPPDLSSAGTQFLTLSGTQ